MSRPSHLLIATLLSDLYDLSQAQYPLQNSTNLRDVLRAAHDTIQSLTASKPDNPTAPCTLTDLLTNVVSLAPSGKAEIYLSRFGTHVSVFYRDAKTEK